MPKRFLVSAVILAINRRLLPLKYRVSCVALLTFSFLFAPIVRSCVLSFSFRALILPAVRPLEPQLTIEDDDDEGF